LRNLASLVRFATERLDTYDYAVVLDQVEKSFWTFCDDYIELVKGRRYGDFGAEAAASANAALLIALSAYLRLFAPYLPFVTEEVWSWWRPGSVHRSAWPTPEEIEVTCDGDGDIRVYVEAAQMLGEIRRLKSLQGLKNKTPVKITVSGGREKLDLIGLAQGDLEAATSATGFALNEGLEFTVAVEAVDSQPEPHT
jgi:valyl-tRNA synthetase